MNRAEITGGAVHGSTSLQISCAAANGTTVVVYRGLFWLGSGVLAGGAVTITVPALAAGDILQASVTERGAAAGVPVIVVRTGDPTGWFVPTEITVDGVLMSAADYLATFGYPLLAYYDGNSVVPVVAPEVPGVVAEPVAPPTILFDLTAVGQAGKTVATVGNVQYQSGGALVRWASGEAWTNVLTREFTANATITVEVRGTGNTVAQAVSKTVAITVFAPPTSAPVSSDIIAFSFQRQGSDSVIVYVNSLKDCECRLSGFETTWRSIPRYGTDYMNTSLSFIPPGSYTLQVRVAGDATVGNWRSVPLSF